MKKILIFGGILLILVLVVGSSYFNYKHQKIKETNSLDNETKVASVQITSVSEESQAKIQNKEIKQIQKEVDKKSATISYAKQPTVEIQKNPICGNGIKEGQEGCDEGDKNGLGSCQVDCTKKIENYLNNTNIVVNSNACSDNIALKVVDENGAALTQVQVEVYAFEKKQKKEKENYFPYVPINDSFLRDVEQINNNNGEIILNDQKYLTTESIIVVVKKEGYLTQFWENTCQNMGANSPIKFTLKSLKKYFYGQNNDANGFPVVVDSAKFMFSSFEVENETIYFPYIPSVRKDLRDGLDEADITLNVVSQKNNLYSTQDLNFYLSKEAKNVKLNEINVFEYTLPQGIYYFYFTFVLKYKDNSIKMFNYYPKIGGGWSVDSPQGYTKEWENYGPLSTDFPVNYFGTVRIFAPLKEEKWVKLSEEANLNKKMNIVFLNGGFDEQLFHSMVLDMTKANHDLNFDNVEPFKSNKDKFVFWYSQNSLSVDEASWPFSDGAAILSGVKPLTKLQNIYLSNKQLMNGPIFLVLLINDETISSNTVAGAGKCVFDIGIRISIQTKSFQNCLNEKSQQECFDQFEIGRVLIHELGHQIGFLGEEYIDNYGGFFDEEKNLKQEGRVYPIKPNNYFLRTLSVEKSCAEALYSANGYLAGMILCQKSISGNECLASPWHDLIGNGCGKEGIVDCKNEDPAYYSEVGCFLGGGEQTGTNTYSNMIKPTRISIMDFGDNYNYVYAKNPYSTVYGEANERALCRAIKAYTGSVGGICDTLCVNGCGKNERCIQGQCVGI